ncbi:MAG TPA: DUF2867 domain-containing protein [Anaerolineales bacterium]|nr:DUF2867 domain-containing protein [Anaerolineales bacterium]
MAGQACRLRRFFAPRGLFGWLYWYGLYPIHALIFGRMLRAIGRAAETQRHSLPG